MSLRKSWTISGRSHLEVTLTAGCPMMCSYCPQDNYIKGYKSINQTSKKLMSLEDYKIILNNVDYRVKQIHFTGFTESLAHPQWDSFIEHTRAKNYKAVVNTTLYNATFEKIDRLIDLDIMVRIHLTDSNINVSKDMIAYFISKYKRKADFKYFTEKGQSLLPEETDIKRKHARARGRRPQSRGGNLKHIPSKIIKGPVRCRRNSFYRGNVVIPNGDVAVCCSDFSLKYILGNLLNQKLIDIHKSEPIKNFFNKMKSGDEKFICNNCVFAEKI